jgi:hypothetical protein
VAFRRWRLAAALVLVVPLKLALERVAKLLVERERPGTTVADAILRGVPSAGLSFTSGHAVITFALEEIGRYLDAGALAVGLGGPLVGDAGEGGNLGPLRRRADAAVAQVREARAR